MDGVFFDDCLQGRMSAGMELSEMKAVLVSSA